MYETILVPTDGSSPANRAIDAAMSIATRTDATVHGVYVLDLREVPASIAVDLEQLFSEEGRRALATVEDAGSEAGIQPVTATVKASASIHEAILKYADEHDVELIVMGSHGRSGIDRFLLGSVTERTVRASAIPVLTIKETPLPADLESVLIPTDGSRGSMAAASHAIDLATAFGAAVHVVHSIDLTVGGGELATGPVYSEFERIGRESVDEVIEQAEQAGVDRIESSILTGSAGRAIVKYATDRDIDVVVIGTHGRSGLDRWLLGSVAEKVVRTAPMPVMTVNVRAREGPDAG